MRYHDFWPSDLNWPWPCRLTFFKKNCPRLWLLNQRGYLLLLFTYGCRRRAMLSSLTTLVKKKLNLDHNFWTKSDRALILHISIPCDKTLLLIPIFLTYGPWPWLWPTFGKKEFVAAGGISPVRTDPDLVCLVIILICLPVKCIGIRNFLLGICLSLCTVVFCFTRKYWLQETHCLII